MYTAIKRYLEFLQDPRLSARFARVKVILLKLLQGLDIQHEDKRTETEMVVHFKVNVLTSATKKLLVKDQQQNLFITPWIPQRLVLMSSAVLTLLGPIKRGLETMYNLQCLQHV